MENLKCTCTTLNSEISKELCKHCCWVNKWFIGRVLLNLQNLPNFKRRKLPKTESMTFENMNFKYRRLIQICANFQSTFAPKFLIASSPDSLRNVSWQLVKWQSRSNFTLKTSRKSRKPVWKEGFGEFQSLPFLKNGFEKHTFWKKKATEKRIGLEEHTHCVTKVFF